jgi:hypothetical protein
MPLVPRVAPSAHSLEIHRFVRAITPLCLAVLVAGTATEARAEPPELRVDANQPLQAAQSGRDPGATRYGFAVMLGLGQWALGGGNVAVQGRIGRLALEYSHGQGVHLSELSLLMNSSEKSVGADVYEPWTTGLGVGLMVTENLRVLLEAKANHYNVQGGDRNTALEYTTFTVGPGVFYEIQIWRGLFLQPSLRWWPTVASTFKDGSTLRRADGASVTMDRHESGIFPNVNLGWEF